MARPRRKPAPPGQPQPPDAPAPAAPAEAAAPAVGGDATLDEVKIAHIQGVIDKEGGFESHGAVTRAAAILDMDPSTIWRLKNAGKLK